MKIRWAVSALVLAACSSGNGTSASGGSSGTSSGGGRPSALVGEWRNTAMAEADRSEGVSQLESTFRFNSDGTWQETDLVTHGETSPTLTSCTESSVINGTYTVQGNLLRLQIVRGTMSRNSCKVTADNRVDAPLSADELRLSNQTIATVQFKWETDTITMSLAGHNDLTLTFRRVR